MSLARPARGALTRCLNTASPRATAAAPALSNREFHSSAPRSNRKPRFRNVKAEEMGLTKPANMAKYQKEKFPAYTKTEEEKLRQKYSPEQVAAIMAGEAAVDPKDIIIQGRLRDDAYRPGYLEDYATLDPRYDVDPEVKTQPEEVVWKDEDAWVDDFAVNFVNLANSKTDRQLTRAMVRAMRKATGSVDPSIVDALDEDFAELERNPELLQKYLVTEDTKKAKPESIPEVPQQQLDMLRQLDEKLHEAFKEELRGIQTSSATDAELELTFPELVQGGPLDKPWTESVARRELGKVPGVEGLYSQAEGEANIPEEKLRLQHLTGVSPQQQGAIVVRTVVKRFVDNQTRLGKIRSASVMAIAGNGDGRLGLGMAKSTSPEIANAMAKMLAFRNMKPIRRYENRTIYGKIKSKVSGTEVELAARPPGFGLRVPHRIFEMCRACGVHDLAARMPRSKNPMNSVKAVYNALTNQPDPEAMAIGRGRKLVDARKVYYGGAVY